MAYALDISEIIGHIGLFLTERELAVCTLVCKIWNDIYSRLLYHSCSIIPDYKIPSSETLDKYASAIRDLEFTVYSNRNSFPTHCLNLTSLTFHCPVISSSEEMTSFITELILESSATLTKISLKQRLFKFDSIWKAVAECPRMSHFEVESVDIPFDAADDFWKVCSKMETLYLRYSRIARYSDNPMASISSLRFPRLQHLKLEFLWGTSIEMDIIMNAPNLKSLGWRQKTWEKFPIKLFRQVMSQQLCPRLHSLSMGMCTISDRDIAMTLDKMTEVRELNLTNTHFSVNAYRSLISHHTSTIRVFAAHAHTVTGAMIQAIMCSCPVLEVLDATSIHGEDLAPTGGYEESKDNRSEASEKTFSGKDWICLRLKSLTMEFKLNRSDSQRQMHEQEHAFRQLSRLTRLERLVINGRDVRSTDSLDLRLQSRGGNLEKLATLRRLVTFDFDYTTQAMSELEISWMLERWPRLRGLMGSFSGIYHEDKKLQSLANFKLYERAIKEQGYE